MFSRFKKDSPAGTSTPQGGTAPVTQSVDKAAFANRAPVQPAAQQRVAAEAVAADKEKKRKERLTELKVEIHKRLLEDLNLSALEAASEQQLKGEIASLASEALDDMSVALNKDDRLALR